MDLRLGELGYIIQYVHIPDVNLDVILGIVKDGSTYTLAYVNTNGV